MIQFKKILSVLLFIFTFQNGISQEITSIKDSLKIDGDVSLRNVLYSVGGIDDRRVPYSYVLGANISVSKGEFSLPFSFTYSEQERSISQPFNQFGISPSYKWAKVHLGYNSLNWNNYTLGGAQFMGAGLELNPKKLRFGFMYGRFRRATPIDSIGIIENKNLQPSYNRNGWATRIGFGTESKHLDLIIFKGKDKDNGISPLKKDSVTFVFPAENTAIGIRTTLPITKWLSFRLDGGLSFFNKDLNAPGLDTASESGDLGFVDRLHKTRLSTSLYYGSDASLNLQLKGHSIAFKTKYVLADYQAMGIYYMDNDVFSYGFDHSFGFWKSKANLSYGLNKVVDNLSNKKMVTTHRFQPVVNLSLNPSSVWGLSANWNNFYTRQEDGTINLSDSFRMEQTNPGLTLTPYANWGDTSVYHSVFLSYSKTQLIDNNPYTSEFSNYTATVYGLNYSQNVIAMNLSWSGGFNYTQNQNKLLNEQAYGFNVGSSKSSEHSKWLAGANLSMQFSNLSNTYSLNLNGNYNLKQQQVLDFGFTFLNNQSKSSSTKDFNEVTFMLTYRKKFNYVHKGKK